MSAFFLIDYLLKPTGTYVNVQNFTLGSIDDFRLFLGAKLDILIFSIFFIVTILRVLICFIYIILIVWVDWKGLNTTYIENSTPALTRFPV